MEKTWENFWTSGRVSDYLAYRNETSDRPETGQNAGQEKQKDNGTACDRDGYGTFSHACQ